MKSRIIILAIMIIAILPVVYSYGVTKPLPYDLELLKGEQGRFKFQIQIVPSEPMMSCSYSVKSGFPLTVTFDEESLLLSPGERKDVAGTVSVPRNVDFGSYTGEICVSCSDATNQAGTVVKQDVCGYPLTVNVVSTRTKDNMFIPAEQKPFINTTMLIIGSIVFLVGLAIIIFISHKKKK